MKSFKEILESLGGKKNWMVKIESEEGYYDDYCNETLNIQASSVKKRNRSSIVINDDVIIEFTAMEVYHVGQGKYPSLKTTGGKIKRPPKISKKGKK